MKISLRRVTKSLFPVTLGLFIIAATGLADNHDKAAKPAKGAKPATTPAVAASKTAAVIKFDAKEVKGAKVWLPKDSTVKAGEPVTLEVHNSLEAPHGFKIEGYVPETAIGAGETKTFTFTPKEKGVLKVTCHLHPAHVGAEIKVQ